MSTPPRLPKPILAVGAYGYRNFGDEAILAGLLRKLGHREMTVVSRSPHETTAMHGVKAVTVKGAAAALATHPTVLIGGGGLFGRDMGRLGRLLPVFGLAAAGAGRQLVIDGVDVDDDLVGSARYLVPQLFKTASRITVRDKASIATLERWGVAANLAPDLSCWMAAAPAEAGEELLQRAGSGGTGGRPRIGLALTALNPRVAVPTINAIAEAMGDLPDAEFCFIPFSRHPFVPAHDDLNLARELRACRAELRIVEDGDHPAAVLAAIGQLDALVAMRYHAMLFAERAGVPLIPISYADKTQRWVTEHGLRSARPEARDLVNAIRAALSTSPAHPARQLLSTAS